MECKQTLANFLPIFWETGFPSRGKKVKIIFFEILIHVLSLTYSD